LYALAAAEWRAVEPHVKKTFLPIFWVEEWSQATSDQLSSFKSQVSALLGIVPASMTVLSTSWSNGHVCAI